MYVCMHVCVYIYYYYYYYYHYMIYYSTNSFKGANYDKPWNSGVTILFSEKSRRASLAKGNTRTVSINLTLLTQLLHLAEHFPQF